MIEFKWRKHEEKNLKLHKMKYPSLSSLVIPSTWPFLCFSVILWFLLVTLWSDTTNHYTATQIIPLILATKSVDAHVTYFDNGWRINYCFAVHILCVVFVHLSNQTSLLVKKCIRKFPCDHHLTISTVLISQMPNCPRKGGGPDDHSCNCFCIGGRRGGGGGVERG